jgi:hypothetical protein
MATRLTYVVFVLPIVLSVAFGSVVMADVIQSSDRDLNMWRIGKTSTQDNSIKIVGLEKQYPVSTPIEIQVKIDDSDFDCGDLYITIYSKNNVITQNGFFNQCFGINHSLLPIDDEFSETMDVPGQYDLVVKMNDRNQKNSIMASEKFTVK